MMLKIGVLVEIDFGVILFLFGQVKILKKWFVLDQLKN